MSSAILFAVARWLIAGTFLNSAYGKLSGASNTRAVIEKSGIPLGQAAYVAALAVEILGAIALLVNVLVSLACAFLIAFVVVASVLVPVKRLRDPAVPVRKAAQRQLSSNAMYVGGLLAVAAYAIAKP